MGNFDHHAKFNNPQVSTLHLGLNKLPLLCLHHVFSIRISSVDSCNCHGKMQCFLVQTVEDCTKLWWFDSQYLWKYQKISVSCKIDFVYHCNFHRWLNHHVTSNFALRIDQLETGRISWIRKWCCDLCYLRGFGVHHQLFKQLFHLQIFEVEGEQSGKTSKSISYRFVQRHEAIYPFIICLTLRKKKNN